MTYEKLIQNIESLSAAAGVNKTTALIKSGVGKNFIYNINKGSTPSSEKIQQLAAYFNVSTDYLLGNTDKQQGDNIDPQTLEFMRLYERLPSDKRDLALKVMKVFVGDE